VSDPSATAPTLLGYIDGRLTGVVVLTIGEAAVQHIDVVLDPARLGALRAEPSSAQG